MKDEHGFEHTFQHRPLAVGLKLVPSRGFEYHPLKAPFECASQGAPVVNKKHPRKDVFGCAPARICSEPPSLKSGELGTKGLSFYQFN